MKKHFRIIGIVLVIAIIAVLIWFGNVMMGNPVSHALASKAAISFLSDRFSGTDYQMERITYSFKDGLQSATSVVGTPALECRKKSGENMQQRASQVIGNFQRQSVGSQV